MLTIFINLFIITIVVQAAVPKPKPVFTKLCKDLKCPKPANCKMVPPSCGSKPVPTCVCPKGQIWSKCPGCTIKCAELLMGKPCLDVCRPPQCICPVGQLFNGNGKCIPQEKCPRLPGK